MTDSTVVRVYRFVLSYNSYTNFRHDVADQESILCRSLKRNITKREAVVDQMSTIDFSDVMPTLQVRATDIELSATDLGIEQDAIFEHLIDLDRDSEFSTIHAAIGKQ